MTSRRAVSFLALILTIPFALSIALLFLLNSEQDKLKSQVSLLSLALSESGAQLESLAGEVSDLGSVLAEEKSRSSSLRTEVSNLELLVSQNRDELRALKTFQFDAAVKDVPLWQPLNNFKYIHNPVLTRGAPGAWDSFGIHNFWVIYDQGEFKGWYSAGDRKRGNWQIGYATSPDGLTWTKYLGNPVLITGAEGEWDASEVQDPMVFKLDSTYFMYYMGLDWDGGYWKIGLATSLDGVTWVKHASNPVLGPGEPGTWDEGGVSNPIVVKVRDTWYMLYSGFPSRGPAGYARDVDIRQGLAQSADMITWTKVGEPIIYPGLGQHGKWNVQQAVITGLIKVGDLYVGSVHGALDFPHSQWGQGIAVSQDLYTWIEHPGNPLLTKTLPKGEGQGVGGLRFSRKDDIFYAYYVYGDYKVLPGDSYREWDIGAIVIDGRPPEKTLILDEPSVLPGITTPLEASKLIELSGIEWLSLTVEASYDLYAKAGIAVRVYGSYDGIHWDNKEWAKIEPPFVPGTSTRSTTPLKPGAKFFKVALENKDDEYSVNSAKIVATLSRYR